MGRVHREDKISGVYCIENKENGKKYIGKTFDIDYRFAEHKQRLRFGNHTNTYLQFSWNKYGENSFKFYLLQECPEELLNDIEMELIEYYNTTDREFGYNRTDGGEGVRGHKHSDATIKIIKEKRAKQVISQKHKDRISEVHTGKFVSDETRDKASFARIGNKKKGRIGHVGVYFHKNRILNPWEARITIKRNTRILLGVFHTEKEAIEAYENAYLKYFGKPFKESEEQ